MATRSDTTIWLPLSGPTSIRLISLHPASNISADLHITLNEVRIENANEYDAVSWTWGSEANQQSILVDGKSISIRENLWRFLRRLRNHDGRARTLWIDALCINQLDNVEKSEQVAMIGDIFKNAQNVLAWVGEPADGSDELLQRLSTNPRVRDEKQDGQRTINAVKHPDEHDTVIIDSIEAARRMQLWTDFLNRSWFSRTWIVQEVVLAKQLLIYCGDSIISWDQIPPFISEKLLFDGILASQYPDPKGRLKDELEMLQDLQHERDRLKAFNSTNEIDMGTSIDDLSRRFSGRQCTDSRDRIYALLALQYPQECGGVVIKPDYTLSVEDVFLSVFRQTCRHEWNLFEEQTEYECAESAATAAISLTRTLGLPGGSFEGIAKLLETGRCNDGDGHIWSLVVDTLREWQKEAIQELNAEMEETVKKVGRTEIQADTDP